MRAGVDARPNDEQSLSGFSIPFSLDRSDSLRNYQEPSVTSGITPSLGSSFTFGSTIPSTFSQGSNAALSNFTVDTSDKSSSVAPSAPIQVPRVADYVSNTVRNFNLSQRIQADNRASRRRSQEGQQNISNYFQPARTPFRGSVGGLAAQPPPFPGVPMPDNTPLRPPDDRYSDRLLRDDTY